MIASLMAAADVTLRDFNAANAGDVFGGNLFSLGSATDAAAADAAGSDGAGFGRATVGDSRGLRSSGLRRFGDSLVTPLALANESVAGAVQRAGFTASLASESTAFRNRFYLDRPGRLSDALRRLDALGPATGPTGDDNISIISEFDGQFIEARSAPGIGVVQTGNRNFSLVIQRDPFPQALVEQVGNGNRSEIRQLATSGDSFARVRQDGDTGVSQIAQSGPGSLAILFQDRAGNDLDSSISQAGIRDEAAVVQAGFQLASLVVQSGGEDNVTGVFQAGERHLSEIVQLGNRNQAYVEQTGNGHRSTINQSGSGNVATVIQSSR